ncbi:hypothetical protein HPP92_020215 [Vanilla planifolia]|uniref:Uncharacterized protein n=1 Tax=Vanilla planifolia TaxID=51239 RepID=A0A835Q8D2_VANPL|nr:hypothetical protein HPP92_020215 [Vanilla planifolia]
MVAYNTLGIAIGSCVVGSNANGYAIVGQKSPELRELPFREAREGEGVNALLCRVLGGELVEVAETSVYDNGNVIRVGVVDGRRFVSGCFE